MSQFTLLEEYFHKEACLGHGEKIFMYVKLFKQLSKSFKQLAISF